MPSTGASKICLRAGKFEYCIAETLSSRENGSFLMVSLTYNYRKRMLYTIKSATFDKHILETIIIAIFYCIILRNKTINHNMTGIKVRNKQ